MFHTYSHILVVSPVQATKGKLFAAIYRLVALFAVLRGLNGRLCPSVNVVEKDVINEKSAIWKVWPFFRQFTQKGYSLQIFAVDFAILKLCNDLIINLLQVLFVGLCKTIKNLSQLSRADGNILIIRNFPSNRIAFFSQFSIPAH
jgi:hypothetical protein